MSENKYEHLIVKRPVPVSKLPHHENRSDVNFPIMMSKSLVPEAEAWVCQFFAANMPQFFADNIKSFGRAVLHKHSAPEIYIFVGDENAVTAEVSLGDEKYEVTSPCCVYIPAGLPHGISPVKAEAGKTAALIPVVLAGEYITEDV